MSLKKLKVSAGYTLVELLVVITIIAILIVTGTAAYLNSQQKGRDFKRKADLAAIQQALELFRADKGAYPDESQNAGFPTNAANFQITCETDGEGNEIIGINWGQPFACNGKTYLNALPKDPSGNNYIYEVYEKPWQASDHNGWCTYDHSNLGTSGTGNCQKYTLWAHLENANDPDIAKSLNSSNTICHDSYSYAATDVASGHFTWAANPNAMNYCVTSPQ